MNSELNKKLETIRTQLQADIEGKNLVRATLSEAEQSFCTEGLALIQAAGYELEGFEELDTESVFEALDAVSEDSGGRVTQQVEMLKAQYAR
jgi:hypothetical protein